MTFRAPAGAITSTRSERVRRVAALSRRSVRSREGLFRVEGPQGVRELLRWAPGSVVDLYVEPGARARQPDIAELARGVRFVHEVAPEVMAAVSDAEHPQGWLAVARPCTAALTDLAPAGFVAVLQHVRDPGNAGTLVRAADAAGASAVIVTDESVDVFSPKVVRSTVGSLWHVDLVVGEPMERVATALRERGFTLLAADAGGETDLFSWIPGGPHAWVLGNEAWGLTAETRAVCDAVVSVPILGQAESLNVATAGALCLYESARKSPRGVEARN